MRETRIVPDGWSYRRFENGDYAVGLVVETWEGRPGSMKPVAGSRGFRALFEVRSRFKWLVRAKILRRLRRHNRRWAKAAL